MTPEEAIDLLDNLLGMIEDNQDNDYDEAIKMAIDLLLRYDDLISRTELISKLKHLEKFNNSDVPEWIWRAIGGTK